MEGHYLLVEISVQNPIPKEKIKQEQLFRSQQTSPPSPAKSFLHGTVYDGTYECALNAQFAPFSLKIPVTYIVYILI